LRVAVRPVPGRSSDVPALPSRRACWIARQRGQRKLTKYGHEPVCIAWDRPFADY